MHKEREQQMSDLYDKMINAGHEYIGKVAQAAEWGMFTGKTKKTEKQIMLLKKKYNAELDRLQKEEQTTNAG
jgi:hypothetical protein